jgi:hypothetical protein
MSVLRSNLNIKVFTLAAIALASCGPSPSAVTSALTSTSSTTVVSAQEAFTGYFEQNEETKIASGTKSGTALVASQAYAPLDYNGVDIPKDAYYLLSVAPEGSVAYLLESDTNGVSRPHPVGPGSFVFEVTSKTGRRLSMLRNGVVSDVLTLKNDTEWVSFASAGADMLAVAQGGSVKMVSLLTGETTAQLDIPKAVVQDLYTAGGSALAVVSSSGEEAVEINGSSIPSDVWFVLPLDLKLSMGNPVLIKVPIKGEDTLGVDLQAIAPGVFRAEPLFYSSGTDEIVAPLSLFDASGREITLPGVLSAFDSRELRAARDGGTVRTSKDATLTYFKKDKQLWEFTGLCGTQENPTCRVIGAWSSGVLIEEWLDEDEYPKNKEDVPAETTSALRFVPAP